MRCFLVFPILLSISLLGSGAEPKEQAIHFSKKDKGKPPTGWTVAKTGAGEGSAWKVVEDASSPSKTGFVLAQTAQSPESVFNLCVLDEGSFKDLTLSVAFKAVEGKNDEGGGLVWRYADARNYYVAHMNPLRNNLRLYKVVEGRRTQLATKEDLIKVGAGSWHTLQIHMNDSKVKVSLDGEELIDATDKAFPRAGKVGLGTESDARTYFDDFKVQGK
jgi:hypothetical protein